MRFRDDTRGVTVQVGAVLLFATIIIALSVYQATVVPSENADVEYRHSQQVQGQLVDVRNALVATAETGNARPATVSLGTEYPNRVFLVNPPPAAGTLRTDTYDDPAIEVSNVEATDGETRDYLGGSWTQPTKALSYVPGYNEYRDAPQLRYEASLLANYFPEENTSVPLTDQLLVDSETRTLSLVALNGSLGTSRSSSVAVSPSALSAPAQRVQVQPQTSGQPVNVTIPTVVDASVLRNATDLGDNPDVTVTQAAPQRVTLSVGWSGPFTLRTAKVGVGSGATDPEPHYLTVVESDDDSVTVEARDEYSNPESGVTVSVNGTNPFESASAVTGADGRATFDATDGVSPTTATLSILDNSDARERVDVEVDTSTGTAANGSEAYVVDWLEGESATQNPGLSCSGETCTLDASLQSSVTLFADSTPTVDGGTFEFAVSNTSIGTVSPSSNTTTGAGESSTEFSAVRDGTGYVYVSGGGSGDRLSITVTNTSSVVYNGDGRAGVFGSSLLFSVTNNRATDVTVTDIRVDPTNPSIARLDDPSFGTGAYQSEFYMTTPGDGDEYVTDFGGGEAIPQTFDLSNGQPGTDEDHLIEASETAEYTLYEFLDGADNGVDMTGEEVEITLFFSDGTQTTFTVGGGGSGSTSAEQTSYVSGSGSAARAGPESRVDLDIENTGGSAVTITDIEVSSPSGSLRSLLETRGGSGQAQHEAYIDSSTPGLLEPGGSAGSGNEGNQAYQLGTVASLTEPATLSGGEQAQMTLLEFRNNGGQAVSAADKDVTVTLYFQDGSSRSFTFTPPGY